jgi:hypothetical protein
MKIPSWLLFSGAKLKSQVRFRLWSLRNPGRRFTDYYAESVMRTLSSGKPHASLGPKLKSGSRDAAKNKFDWLVSQGVQPKDIVVDYGCGTLRIGVLLIEYLDANCYIGMDIDERILDLGRASLATTLREAKRPTLEIISSESLQHIAARRPKWVFSKGVLHHVPPKQLHEYFNNVSRLIHVGATGFVATRTASTSKQLSSTTWVHGLNQLEATALSYGMTFERVDQKGSIFKLCSQSA